ncbi:hypothetical protein EGH10_07265 [Brevibacillus laterosporus]|uniref:Lipoprotein n=1 Tax=Brevibacillus laterosporus LMG 15441 TaxID=1042163 RepID=A0A075R281_BRELA|nr:hypothetical protein [Brevibacillus laterosporus]AIG25313.1 hypothetical protein BRLA_c009730 [Brevibacillus laterosporus LMG 15441]RJL10472.1 hypothetical protein DM460_12560 [Brevibacillus laterosporus]TPH14986.1 hypothetical protein EGH10_07265 [Brevibacillus laterosporus]
MNKKEVAACLSAFLLLLLLGCQSVEQQAQQAYSEPKQLESMNKTDIQNICTDEQDCIELGNRLVKEISVNIPELLSMEEYEKDKNAESKANEKGLSIDAQRQNAIETQVLMKYKINAQDELVEPYQQKLDTQKWRSNSFATDLKREELEKWQKDTRLHHEMWNFYKALIPKEQRKQLTEFTVMTDGKQHVLANLIQSEDGSNKWRLEMDALDFHKADPQLVKELIHETAHLISLGEDQMQSYIEHDKPKARASQSQPKNNVKCDSLHVKEGCTKKDSYLNKFYQQFWSMYEKEWEQTNVETDAAAKRVFYDTYHQEFVSEYAITNVVEDWAETFTMFTLHDFSQNETTSESQQKFAKMKSLYAYSELVKVRTEILYQVYKLLPELKQKQN